MTDPAPRPTTTDGPLPRWHPDTLRAAGWALRAVVVARRAYRRSGVAHVRLPEVRAVDHRAQRGVLAVLSRTRQRCLVRATVRQAWLAAHGEPRDLIIGVTRPGAGFRAHAWLEGDDPGHHEGYTELTRRQAPS
ncbi:MAG TPA: lasso peptide biosynthesis B2 protein [Nitriliruptorales bacterium]